MVEYLVELVASVGTDRSCVWYLHIDQWVPEWNIVESILCPLCAISIRIFDQCTFFVFKKYFNFTHIPAYTKYIEYFVDCHSDWQPCQENDWWFVYILVIFAFNVRQRVIFWFDYFKTLLIPAIIHLIFRWIQTNLI